MGNYKFTITSDDGNKTSLRGATIRTGVENVADDNADAP